jgi:hypothetical protein
MAALVLSAAALASPASGVTLKGDYQLEGNHSSSAACASAPNLVDVGEAAGLNTFATEIVNGSTNGVLTFPEGNGVNLNTQSILPRDRFTVIMQFRLTRVASGTGYVSLLVSDTDPPTNDSGLYVHEGSLDIYDDKAATRDHEEASPSVAPGTYIEVALTRNGAGQLNVYANGALRISYEDVNASAALLTNAIEFFRENGTEESAGAVARIRVYDDALSPAQVSAPPPCPQTGSPVTTAKGKKCKKKKKHRAAEAKKKKCKKKKKK